MGGLVCTLFIVVLLGYAVWQPEQLAGLVSKISPGCAFRRYTGISCPGCGGTRAAVALLQGDIVGAVRYNLILPLGVLALMAEYVRMLLLHFTRLPDWANHRSYTRIFLFYAWGVLVWFVARNLLGI